MQRMSNMLTRLLEGRLRQGGNNEARSSNDAPADQESDERGEQDLSGETGGIDSSSSVLTAESSLSSSDASSAAFVSCSASDREVSNEDSKDAFETSECAPADRRRSETKERQTSPADRRSSETEDCQTFRVHPGRMPDDDEGDVVADGRQFISGSQTASETALLETMPSLPDHSSNIAVSNSNEFATNSNEFATPIDLCAKGQGRDDGVISAVVSETVAEQLDDVSPNQKRLSRDKLVAEPGSELLAVVNATCGRSSDQTETKVDETPVCLGTVPVSSGPAAELVSARLLQSDRLAERIPAAECAAGAEQKIIGTSDVLLGRQAAESSDMSCDGAVSLESYASFTSAQTLSMQEAVTEDSVLISIASSGADSADGAGLNGREDEPTEEEEASGSLGIFQVLVKTSNNLQ